MDHLPIPEVCKEANFIVPYIGIAPVYDREGFRGFPARVGIDPEELDQQDLDQIIEYIWPKIARPAMRDLPSILPGIREYCLLWIMSFLQEWLWFGVLQEMERAFEVPLPWDRLTSVDMENGVRRLDTTWMTGYARAMVIHRWSKHAVRGNFKVGDVCYVVDHARECNHSLLEDVELCKARALSFGFSDPQGYELGPYMIKERCDSSSFKLRDLDGQTITVSRDDLEIVDMQDCFTALASDLASDLASQGLPLKAVCKHLNFGREEGALPATEARPEASAVMHEAEVMLQKIHNSALSKTNTNFALACSILYESWRNALELLFGQRTPGLLPMDLESILEEGMIANGWCRRRTSKFFWGAGAMLPFISSQLPSYDERLHLQCTYEVCYEDIDVEPGLNPPHILEVCQGDCDLVSIDEDELIRIIKSDGIPGLEIASMEESSFEIAVCDIRNRPYVAISHVWAHGLGNKFANALPLCQLKKLFQLINGLPTPATPVLWIDTLTVPIDFEYKLIAIGQLRRIYMEASMVLIVDRNLMQVGDDPVERRLQILGSDWQRRLWTLQEGRLASKLWVQFKDVAVPIEELCSPTTSIQYSRDCDIYENVLRYTGEEMTWHFKPSSDNTQLAIDILQDVGHRVTTVATDEPICLAVMLRLNLEDYVAPPTMADVYRDVKVFPRNIVFIEGRKMNETGLRWAPSSLLNKGYQLYPNVSGYPERHAYVEKTGLFMLTDYIELVDDLIVQKCSVKGAQIHTFIIEVPDGHSYFVELDDSELEDNIGAYVTVPHPLIVLEKDINSYRTTSRGVLVSCEPFTGETSSTVHRSRYEADAQGYFQWSEIQYCRFRWHVRTSNRDLSTIRASRLVRKGLTVGCRTLSGRLCRSRLVCVD